MTIGRNLAGPVRDWTNVSSNLFVVLFEIISNFLIISLLISPLKIKKTKKIQQEKNLNFDIEIDGGINFENCKIAIDAGANILVSGTTIFKSNDGDIKKNIDLLKLK